MAWGYSVREGKAQGQRQRQGARRSKDAVPVSGRRRRLVFGALPRPNARELARAAVLFSAVLLATASFLSESGHAADRGRDGYRLRVPGLDSLAAVTLHRALGYLDLSAPELGFDKLYAEDDTFRLALVERLLASPLQVPGWQEQQVEALRHEVHHPALLAHRLGLLCEAPGDEQADRLGWPGVEKRLSAEDGEAASTATADRWTADGATASGTTAGGTTAVRMTDGDIEKRVLAFLRRTGEAEQDLLRAFREWSVEERIQLLTMAPAFWGDSEDPADKIRKGALHFERGLPADTTLDLSEDFVLDLASQVDREALTLAAQRFLEAVCRFAGLDPKAAWPEAAADYPGVGGAVVGWHETPWGLLLIGGPGDNTYSYEALSRISFLIEPGGNDVYRGRIASAVGGITWPFAALVDYAGDDLYDAHGLSYALGGALMGVSVLIDAGGNDLYRGDDGSLGAGFFGAGFLFDGGGVDYFAGRNLCQGAGAFGIGALVSGAAAEAPAGPELQLDRAFEAGVHAVPGTGAVPLRYDDSDTYVCARQSQGFASTFGAGLLFDQAGNDVYRAGGRYLHAPLLPNDFQALSQGFSIGFRPRAGGGVGILMDEAGNDFYNGDVYSQGSAYWYSVGLLYDGAGNDRYTATQYSQGAGIHLAVGSLWDRGGDDHYVCKFGVTQGTAHDLSVGWLYDESGNDYYLVSDGHGISITNSVAVFIDALGNDVYATPGIGQGTVTWARGFCGAGLFLDLEGTDTYPAGAPATDGAVWRQRTYGLGIDLDRDIEVPGEVVPEITLTAEDSLRTVEELFETASLWEVGSAREKVRRARKALIAKGPEAIDHVVRTKLDTRSGLEYRAIQELAEAHPDTFTARVLPLLEEAEGRTAQNVIGLLGDLKCSKAREPMEALLGKKSRRDDWNRLIAALGRIGNPEAAKTVRKFLDADEERRRLVAIGAVDALEDTTSLRRLVEMLGDRELTVRAAAGVAVRHFGVAAVSPLCRSLTAVEDDRWPERELQAALRTQVLGQVAQSLADSTDERSVRARGKARQTLLEMLDRGYELEAPALRAAAVEALMALGGPETEARVKVRLADEYDPLVLRTFETAVEDQRQP